MSTQQLPAGEVAPEMADLRAMSKADLVNLAAQQRIQIRVLEAVRDATSKPPTALAPAEVG